MFESFLNSLSAYMQANQFMGAIIAGLIACAESIAIIGTIIPGSITMTMIGTMLGSGILNLKLTIACILIGAIIGDFGSYWFGYKYRDRIKQFKIVRNNIKWLNFGKQFIRQYGTMSILVGRFLGPVRCIVPLVAGVLGMPKLKFTLVATPSIILWALVYLTPGFLLGAYAMTLPHNIVPIALGALVAVVCIHFLIRKSIVVANPRKEH